MYLSEKFKLREYIELTMERKRRKTIFDEFFGESIFKDLENIFEEGFPVRGGYSISIQQVGGKTIVNAKVSEEVDVEQLEKELRRKYPNAQINIEGGKPRIREVTEEKEEKGRDTKTLMQREARKPRIIVEDE
ncbi:MAG: hypothetical protein QXY40_00930 [Candidatus Methanomethylicia archaeon]